MSNTSEYGIISKKILTNIADAIRDKSNSSSTMKPSQMASNIKDIPSSSSPSYTQISCIRATGVQHINTGFTPSSTNLKYIVTMANTSLASGTSRGSLFGGVNESTNKRSGGIWLQSGYDMFVTVGSDPKFWYTPVITEKSTATIIVDDSNVTLTVTNDSTDESNTYGPTSYSGSVDTRCYIFSGTYSDFHTCGELYAAKIYQDDILVRDFIPVLDKFNNVALYDKVYERFYYNEATDVDFEYEL
jgi:hypothetical protein